MNSAPNHWTRWTMLALFAAAMAWVESAVVFYLRLLAGGTMDPYHPDAFPPQEGIAPTEVIREAATMIMLFGIGWLTGRNWRSRLGYTLIAFGIWDIFYYVFLRVITGWPTSLLNWDILFLIPLPWWGPVIAPMSIAALMIAWGTLVNWDPDSEPSPASGWPVWGLCFAGILLALYVFMSDAIHLVRHGTPLEELRNHLPVEFNWGLFSVAWVLMSAPVVDAIRKRRSSLKSSAELELGP